MMGKPNTLEEQEEQKKREAESFFAQKDSGPNSERSEVTPSTEKAGLLGLVCRTVWLRDGDRQKLETVPKA